MNGPLPYMVFYLDPLAGPDVCIIQNMCMLSLVKLNAATDDWRALQPQVGMIKLNFLTQSKL